MRKKNGVKLPTVTQLNSGKYFTRIMINGKQIPITRDTEKECIAEYMALKTNAKKAAPSGSKTLAQAIDRYIENRDGLISPSTIRGYQSYRNRFESLMHKNIYNITDQQWQAAIKQEAKSCSPKYLKNVWGMISGAILEETGTKPKVILPNKENNEHPFLEPEQLLVFVDAIKGDPVEIAALLEISSLRASEMIALKWEDVELQKETIHVRGARVRDKDGQIVHKRQNKNDTSRRFVPIIPPLKAALSAVEDKNGYVVLMSSAAVYEKVNRLCRKLGFPEVGNHGLRHSFASLAYHLQIPEKIAMEIGGWANDQTMRKIYTHLCQRDIAKRAKDFSRFFDTFCNEISNEK